MEGISYYSWEMRQWFPEPLLQIFSHPITERFYLNFSAINLVCFAIVFIYGIYPIRDSIIRKRGHAKFIIERETIKKILYIEIPILTVLTLLWTGKGTDDPYYLLPFITIDLEEIIHTYGTGGFYVYTPLRNLTGATLYSLQFNLGASVTAGIIYMVLQATKRELRYFLAKTCFELASNDCDKIRKIGHFILGLKFYNEYLKKTLKIQINGIGNIYSKVISDSTVDQHEVTKSVLTSFESCKDKLEPVKSLSKIIDSEKKEEFLIEESLVERIKDLAVFFATIIPVGITIIRLLAGQPSE